MARRTPARLSPAASGDLPVEERRLDNGLTALVLPRRGTPVVVVDLYYPVGSFDEPPGLSGLAHFVEHMLFKGTERFPKGQIDRLVAAMGGHCNAETSEDNTHYWFTFPSDRWEQALTIEADRMNHARFDPVEVELERRVIGEERARELGSPQGRLDQNHLAVTYLRHPYRNPILGWPEDAARIGVEDLESFYHRHYRPDGAVLVVAGDVQPGRALDRIAAAFQDIPSGRAARARPRVSEPRQTGRRDFVLVETDGVTRGLLGWRTVPRGHRDAAALDVLSDLLTVGRRSRLWQALVEESGQATWVDASHGTAQRGGQFVIAVDLDSSANRGDVEARIFEELRRLAEDGPLPEELARSRCRLDAAWRWERDDLAALASGLGHAALWGDWRRWPAEHRAAMAVTARDIRRVAAAYLDGKGLTAGWTETRDAEESASATTVALGLSPAGTASKPTPASPASTSESAAGPVPAVTTTATAPPPARGGRGSRLSDYRPRRVVLDNGLRLVWARRPGAGVVSLEFYCDAGMVREATPGVASLTGRLLEEGTTSRDAVSIARAIEDAGGSLEVGATGASLRIRAEDLAPTLELLADVVQRPAFPDDAIRRVSRRMAAELNGDLDDPAFRAELSFRGLVYGPHPLARDPRGGRRELARITRADVLAHHHPPFVPVGASQAVAGDFDPRPLSRLVEQGFGQWPRRAASRPPFPEVLPSGRPRVRRIPHASDQIHLYLGHLGVARNHPDYEALLILDHIFGSGPGFNDRLGRIIRDEMGLVY
ncbi:MAG: M16 family metallopeptidase, partial [Isosphaeraceae bacterium]